MGQAVLSALYKLIHLIFTSKVRVKYIYYPHSADRKAEVPSLNK